MKVVVAGGSGLIGSGDLRRARGGGPRSRIVAVKPERARGSAGAGSGGTAPVTAARGPSPSPSASQERSSNASPGILRRQGDVGGELGTADAVINLAGASIGHWPWTKAPQGRAAGQPAERRPEVWSTAIGLVAGGPDRPKVLLSASGTGPV